MSRRGLAVDAGTTGATKLRAVTPNDSTDLPDGIAAAIRVGTAGDVAVVAESDTTAVTLKAAFAGETIAVRAKRIVVAGTTATNIVALYN